MAPTVAPENNDSTFTWEDFLLRYNGELADILGNYIHRGLVFNVNKLGGKIPEPIAAITRKAMAMRQDERYQTVKDLQAAVQAFQAGPVIAPVVQPSPPANAEAPVSSGKKTKLLLIALAVIIAVLAGLCVKLLMDRSRIEAALHGKR